MSKPGLTIAQAAKALGISAKTVRRHIKDGRISAEITAGKYGDEYRILGLPPEKIKERTLDTTPTLAIDIITRLEEENRNLAGQLGAALERTRTLEGQLKLLAAGKQPWWRRLFKRKE